MLGSSIIGEFFDSLGSYLCEDHLPYRDLVDFVDTYCCQGYLEPVNLWTCGGLTLLRGIFGVKICWSVLLLLLFRVFVRNRVGIGALWESN